MKIQPPPRLLVGIAKTIRDAFNGLRDYAMSLRIIDSETIKVQSHDKNGTKLKVVGGKKKGSSSSVPRWQ